MKKYLFILIPMVFFCFNIANAQSEKKESSDLKIKIKSGEIIITATLNNSKTSEDFIKKLPTDLIMKSHQNREYYSDIKLSTNSPVQNGYEIGDIGYWVPGGTIVFFYDKGYTDNLIIMGKITSGIDKLRTMEKSFTAKIEQIKN